MGKTHGPLNPLDPGSLDPWISGPWILGHLDLLDPGSLDPWNPTLDPVSDSLARRVLGVEVASMTSSFHIWYLYLQKAVSPISAPDPCFFEEACSGWVLSTLCGTTVELQYSAEAVYRSGAHPLFLCTLCGTTRHLLHVHKAAHR